MCADVKLITLGNASTGKTSFILRYCEDKFDDKYAPTIGPKFHKTITLDNTIDLCFVDTSGQEIYNSLNKQYYRGADIVFFVFALDDLTSFSLIRDHWYDTYMTDSVNDNSVKILIGTKLDLLDPSSTDNKIVEYEEYASDKEMKFFAISNMDGEGFDKLREYVSNSAREITKHKTGPILSPVRNFNASVHNCCS